MINWSGNLAIAVLLNIVLNFYSISNSIVNWQHPLSRRRERVRVRGVELNPFLFNS
jgi:hypothetical protein